MDDTITEFTRGLFTSYEMHRVADLAYAGLLNGKPNALRLLSGYLVGRGCVVIIKGHEVRARSAGTRSVNPPQIIFDLHGGCPEGVSSVARMIAVNVHCKAYFLDKTASADLREMEDRDEDGLAGGGEDPSDYLF